MEKIKHLHNRAGFGLSPGEWQQKRDWTVPSAVDELFDAARSARALPVENEIDELPDMMSMPDSKEKGAKVAQFLMKEGQKVATLGTEWVGRMASPSESALLERVTLFWHGHFACESKVYTLAVNQLNTLRKHALGPFRELALAVARDPSMIRYLNNQQNRKGQPNENFARELMELFTIGRGHYTEQDVREAARAFTGWSSNIIGEYTFRRGQHDYGSKTFMGKTGNFNGEDIIDILLNRRETALFLTRKIYRYFVNDQPDEMVINDLADLYYNSDYDTGRLLRHIFTADWFYAPANTGNKIKSPVTLMAGIMRALELKFQNDMAPAFIQRSLGQLLFHPPNVAGWPGGKAWIDNATLMLRLNLGAFALSSKEVNLRLKDDPEAAERGKAFKRLSADANLGPILQLTQGKSRQAALETLSAYLLSLQPKLGMAELADALEETDETLFLKKAVAALMSFPEYQLC
ncbi:MAG: DUF1800 domain-containing protein [Lewinellaceae bacterium]|nr:DUF1800 domain-containing protein [Lewinellaceae bacterium]